MCRSCVKFNAKLKYHPQTKKYKEPIQAPMETLPCMKRDADGFEEITVTDCCKVIVGTFLHDPPIDFDDHD